jgi:hypothetical protein
MIVVLDYISLDAMKVLMSRKQWTILIPFPATTQFLKQLFVRDEFSPGTETTKDVLRFHYVYGRKEKRLGLLVFENCIQQPGQTCLASRAYDKCPRETFLPTRNNESRETVQESE